MVLFISKNSQISVLQHLLYSRKITYIAIFKIFFCLPKLIILYHVVNNITSFLVLLHLFPAPCFTMIAVIHAYLPRVLFMKRGYVLHIG
jgi:hypothetical protein